MNSVAVVIDSIERYYFYRRLVANVKEDFDFHFYTSEPMVHVLMVMSGYKSRLLRRVRNDSHRDIDELSRLDVEQCIEVLNGNISVEQAVADCRSIFLQLMSHFETDGVVACVLWNGQQLLCRTAAAVSIERGISTRYLELSNLPNKIFADFEGVNANSSLAKRPDTLDSLALPSTAFHEKWLQYYEVCKARPLPQSRTKWTRKVLSAVNLGLKFPTGSVVRQRLGAYRVKNSGTFKGALALSREQIAEKRYAFLALQVSGDTQLKLHSNVDNIQAIHAASQVAKERGIELLVKIHPAEVDEKQIEAVFALSREMSFTVISANTTDLIKHAQVVVTINSTVGLEAMLYEKEVRVLGRCLYRDFDRGRLLKYVHSFLIDGVDYFGADLVDREKAFLVLVGR